MPNDLDLRKPIAPQNQTPLRPQNGAAGFDAPREKILFEREPTQPLPRPEAPTPANQAPAPFAPPSAAPDFNMIDAMYADRFGAPVVPPEVASTKRVFRLPGFQGTKSQIVQRTPATWLHYLRRVPKRVWGTFLFGVFSLTIVGIVLTLLLSGGNAAKIDRSLAATDQQRQRDLNAIQSALRAYFDANEEQYPIVFANIEITGSGDPLSGELVPLYLATMPLDPNFPQQSYRYASLTGKSYVLSAELENGQTYRLTESDEK